MGKFFQCLAELSAQDMIMVGYYSLTFFYFFFNFTAADVKKHLAACHNITKTYLYNFDPLKPLFYIVKLGFTGLYIIFLIVDSH